jgi:tRNA A-37 threonylcarbamoyl transferase component Bud32
MFAAEAAVDEPVRMFTLVLPVLAVTVLSVAAIFVLLLRALRSEKRLEVPQPGPPTGKPRERRPSPVSRVDAVPAPEGHCLECATRLPPDSPDGLCPQCLLQGGLSGAADHPPEDPRVRTTPHPGAFTAPTPAELAPHFPQLEVLELIGQGGMGAVYKARQTKLDRLVAVKVLPPEWGRDPAFAERFTREACALAKLSHPHIVAVHDFGETAGLYYLVMEYVDGPNLRQVLQAGRLAPEQALAVIPQMCDALQYAHEEGVVHRDIKPENILLDRRGRVKVADFGLAKLLGGPRVEFTLTGSRQVMGTLDYMAPEQRQSPLEIDHRADIYSLGVVFYEMLTGELPLGRFAPPSERAAVDARLDGVVFRALETDPGRRYQSVGAVKTDVEAIAGGQAPAPRAVPPADRGGGADLGLALHQVRGPATGLLWAGVLTPLAWALGLLLLNTDPLWMAGKPNAAWQILYLCLFVLSLAPAAIVIVGALKMRRCEAYELALIAGITALIPFGGPAWLLSLPMGLWAILVLCKPRVRAGFARHLEYLPGSDGGPPPGLPAGPVLRDRARQRLTAPAAALVCAGIIQCAGQLLLAFPLAIAAVTVTYPLLTGGNAEADLVQNRATLAQIVLVSAPGLALALAWVLFGLWVGRTMILAGLRMPRLESYRLALKGSLLAMLPCTLTWLVTLPVGLWAYVVLRDLDVEAAFAPDNGREFVRSAPAPRPTGPVRRKVRSFVESVLAMFVTRPGKDYPAEEDPVPERS